jgi:NADH-quinone oxidoreductase subunit A
MYFDYLNVLVFAGVGLAFVFANLIVASVIRPRRVGDVGLETYECGEATIGDAWVNFDIRYYTVALVYIVFAVEIAFLFPWAIVLNDAMTGVGAAAGKDIGAFALVEGFIFIGILFLGLAYVWAKGDLDWIMSYSASPYQPPEPTRKYHLPAIKALEKAEELAAHEADTKSESEEDVA